MRKQFVTGLFPESGRFGPGDYQSVKLLIVGSHLCLAEENEDGREIRIPGEVKKAIQIKQLNLSSELLSLRKMSEG